MNEIINRGIAASISGSRVTALYQLYHDAPKLHADGVHVIHCDEKTGIQALEREITPMKAKHK